MSRNERVQQQALALEACRLAIRASETGIATTGAVETIYQRLCRAEGLEARGHTQFWVYLRSLDALGLVSARRSGKGYAGVTTLITLPGPAGSCSQCGQPVPTGQGTPALSLGVEA